MELIQRAKPYAKSLVLLALIVLAAIADAAGVIIDLDVEHYVTLLVAEVLVFAVPNKGYVEPDVSTETTHGSV